MRFMPEDCDIERSVLGLIINFESLHQKVTLLNDEDFIFPFHRQILKLCKVKFEADGYIDWISIVSSAEGDEKSDLKRELTNCAETAISTTVFDSHFAKLKELSSRRRIVSAVNDLIASGECTGTALQKIVDNESRLNTFGNCIQDKNKEHITEFLQSLNTPIEKLYTGFDNVDRFLGGIRKGTVFIIGARPSTGKTSFALNIARSVSRGGKKVLFFSLEMTATMIYERVLSAECNVPYSRFSNGGLKKDEIEKITKATEIIQEKENFLVCDNVYDIEFIVNQIAESQPDLCVIDFMQIINSINKFENARARIDYISSELKKIAKKTGTAIIVLSQLTRNGKEKPTMSDLKESGGLEQDGDYIALLHRPFVLDKGSGEEPGKTELSIDKNKFGRAGKTELFFDVCYQKFYLTKRDAEISHLEPADVVFESGEEERRVWM